VKTYNDPASLGIGSTIWRYDADLRRYEAGGMEDVATEAEKFVPCEIVGETSASWVTNARAGSKDALIPKNPAKRKCYGNSDPFWHQAPTSFRPVTFALAQSAIDDHVFDRAHRHGIASRISIGTSVSSRKLRAILAIVEGPEV